MGIKNTQLNVRVGERYLTVHRLKKVYLSIILSQIERDIHTRVAFIALSGALQRLTATKFGPF